MEANIKVFRPKILKTDSEDSFFMVDEDWVKNNKRFVKDHGLTIEYPKKVETVVKVEKAEKALKTIEVEKSISETKTEKE